jgi:sulfite oxidase
MTRNERVRPYGDDGLNRGTWPDVAADRLITPTDDFFQRSHAPTPALDAATWRLAVAGMVERPVVYSLAELTSAFPRREVAATLVCAGLRRAELLSLGPQPGEVPWGPDAASTGRWSGVGLADVLRAAGVGAEARHVEFGGLDRVERLGREFGFGGSIDLAKALSDEAILATHLNGAPLTPAHGFPLRVVIPGWIGARSVKWLGRISVQPQPSVNYFQAKAYRIQRDQNPADPRDISAGVAMGEIPLNAVILEPRPGATVPAGPVRVRGWAIGSACRPVAAVEVSATGGSEWTQAETVASAGDWTWSFWEVVVHLAPGPHVLHARARDAARAMPATLDEAWNVKGYANNAWYRLEITAS